MPGVFGSLQALEALKMLLGLPGLDPGEMLIFDLVSSTRSACARGARRIAMRIGAQASPPRPRAPTSSKCSSARSRRPRQPATPSSTYAMRASAPTSRCRSPALNLPMSKLLTDAATLDLAGRYLLVCATGKRSAAAADLLRSQGLASAVRCAVASGV